MVYKKIIVFIAIAVFAAVAFGVSVQAQPAAGKSPMPQKVTIEPAVEVSLDVKGMDIVDVLKILSDKGGFNVSISGNVRGRVTLFLKDIDVWDALDIALVSAALACERRGDVIYVMTEREYEAQYGKKYGDKKQVKIFQLRYARAELVRDLLAQVISSIGKVIIDSATNNLIVMDVPEKIKEITAIIEHLDKKMRTKVFGLNYLSAKDFEPKLKEFVTPAVGVVGVDETTNKVFVTDYPDKLAHIERIVKAFDEKPMQVLIDAKIIELRPSKKFYSGINWDYWIEKYFEVQGAFTIPSPSSVTDKISIGTINSDDVAAKGEYTGVMEFLEIFGEAKVLSSPRILALNNREAKIVVGTRDVYITSSVSQVGESAVTSQAVNFVDVGVKLFVTPVINRAGYVTLKIKPEISSAEREQITSEDKVTEIPVVTTSEVETEVIVREGVTIILGGLRKTTHESEKKQIPILGSMPLIGGLFRSNSDEWSKSELVVLLTPHIVSGDKSIEMELQEKEADIYESEAEYMTKENSWDELVDVPEEGMPQAVPDRSSAGSDAGKEKGNAQIKLSSPPDYRSLVSGRLYQASVNYSRATLKGKARLKFSLARDGSLVGEPQVKIVEGDDRLLEAVEEIVAESIPFPASDRPQNFELLFVFDGDNAP